MGSSIKVLVVDHQGIEPCGSWIDGLYRAPAMALAVRWSAGDSNPSVTGLEVLTGTKRAPLVRTGEAPYMGLHYHIFVLGSKFSFAGMFL